MEKKHTKIWRGREQIMTKLTPKNLWLTSFWKKTDITLSLLQKNDHKIEKNDVFHFFVSLFD